MQAYRYFPTKAITIKLIMNIIKPPKKGGILNLPLDISIVPAVLIALGIAFLYVTNDNNHLLENKKAEAEA